jgi:histidine triad (HIT) family protein
MTGASSSLPGCAFCAIARGADRSVEILCEGDTWIAFFPETPATPGHTLVIPRTHVPDLWSADSRTGGDLIGAVIRVGRAIQSALIPEGMNLISSAGDAAEQTVFHLHLHVVPRWHQDELDIWPPKKPMQKELKDDLAESIRAVLADDTPL